MPHFNTISGIVDSQNYDKTIREGADGEAANEPYASLDDSSVEGETETELIEVTMATVHPRSPSPHQPLPTSPVNMLPTSATSPSAKSPSPKLPSPKLPSPKSPSPKSPSPKLPSPKSPSPKSHSPIPRTPSPQPQHFDEDSNKVDDPISGSVVNELYKMQIEFQLSNPEVDGYRNMSGQISEPSIATELESSI